MTTFALTCLGAFTCSIDSQTITHFPTDKVQALLAYLALEPRAHRREALAGLFWPEIGEEYARKNLRSTLHRLRQTLDSGSAGAAATLLLTNRQTVELAAAALTVDALAVERGVLACEQHAHSALAHCDACLANLTQVVTLYQGELLAGFGLVDAPAFEEWLVLRREHLHHHLLRALGNLADAYTVRGELETAHTYATRQLTFDPYREDVHRRVMRLLAQRGLTHQALAHYATCCRLLREELGVEPDAETTALYEEIRTGKLADKETRRGGEGEITSSEHNVSLSPGLPVSLSAVHDWGEMPAVDFFQGRALELAQLERWLTPERGTIGAQLVAVLGIGGVGKTTLAAAVTKAVAPTFATVIWRSLLNAPPLAEILRGWLQILGRQTLTALPESQDEQLRLLLDYLRQQRCLLVLDNVESLLLAAQEGRQQAGALRPGYAGYADLLQRVATVEHQSCLLLTSREQPYVLVQLTQQMGGAAGRVRALPLAGLDPQAGHTLLQINGLSASAQEAALLVKNYSGNPLALQIVATTIADFFGGDIAAFQQEEGFLFDGIRTVLDQQFARLSDLEQEILVWLAIEREAITVHTLRSNLVQAPSTAELLGALHALQARSLLEKTGDGLTLQNVIIEYTTEYLIEAVCAELNDKVTRWQGFAVSAQPNGDKVTESLENSVTLSPPHPVTLSFLNRFALLKAQAKEYVRQSQARLILQPVLTRMLEKLNRTVLEKQLRQIIATLQRRPTPSERGYAAGNILNLLLRAGFDVTGCDLSHLAVWQAYLRENTLYDVNLAHADLSGSAFVKPFNMIMALAYSPDGELLAGGSMEGAIFIWKAEDGYLANVYHGHTSVIYSVAFSPDKTMLASASQDYSIRVWDVRNGQTRFVLSDHTSFVNSVAFSPDGRLLASGSDDHTVRLWNAQSGAALATFTNHSDRVTCVAFGADGKTVASCANDQTICIWDAEQGTLIETLHEQVRPNAIAYDSLNGRIVSVGSTPTVRFWQLASGEHQETPPMHTHAAESIFFDPTYSIVASGSIDQTVRLWDAQTHETLRVLHGHREGIRAIAFSPDGQRIASTSTDRTVCQWQVQTGALLQVYSGYSGRVDWLGFDAQNELIACTSQNGQVRIWQVRGGSSHNIKAEQATLNQPLALDSNSPMYICRGVNNTASIRNLQDSSYHWTLEGHTAPITAVAAATGGRLFATGSRDASVRIWDVGTRKVQHILAAQSPTIWAVSFSQDQELLATDSDGTVLVWNTLSGQLLHRLEGHTHVCESFGFRHDRAILASGSQDHTICLWDIATGQLRDTLHGHTGTVNALAFSPDGLLLVSGSGDMNVHIWDVVQGRLLHRLTGHSGWVMKLVFMPDGNTIATGSYDGMVKLWDVYTGACLETFQPNGPYANMNITGVTGISAAQKAALRALGAVGE